MFKYSLFLLLAILTVNVSSQSLRAHYKFSGNANDCSSYNNNNAVVYGANLTTDRFGNPSSAYEFDGVNDYISTQTTYDYQSRTISVWAMVYDTINENVVYDQDASSLSYGNCYINFKYEKAMGNAGGSGGNQMIPHLATQTWYHIVIVRGTTGAKYYVNSNLVATSGVSSVASVTFPNPIFTIGTNRELTNPVKFFNGKIDDLAIWSKELTPDQIDSLYMVGPDDACLAAYYSFTGNAQDESGNGNNGMVMGPIPSIDRFSNPGSAYQFDGLNDYISTQSTFDFEERTISVWAMVYDTTSENVIFDQDATSLSYGNCFVNFKYGEAFANAGGSGAISIIPHIDVNQWYHIALVRKINTAEYYVDGNLVATSSVSSNASNSSPNPIFTIGTNREITNPIKFFNGKIDDLAIYRCALSPTQIDSLATIGVENVPIDKTFDFTVYPNPVNNEINIMLPEKSNEKYQVKLVNAQGQELGEYTIDAAVDNKLLIDRNNLPSGLYFISIYSNQSDYNVKKIIFR